MMKTYQCRLGKRRRPHLLNNPVQLPCQALVCWQCVLDQKDYFNNLRCNYCGQIHQVEEELLLKHTFFLQRNLILNTREIAHDMSSNLKKSIFNFKDYLSYRKKAMANMFEFIQDSIEIRFESVRMELENVLERLNESIDTIKSEITDEVKYTREKRMYLNTIKHTKKPKMNSLLKDLRKLKKGLEKSGNVVENLVNKLTESKEPSKPLHKDKSIWLGSLKSTLKPVQFSEVLYDRVKTVDLFGYTTNSTSMCPFGSDGFLILDNYLNSVSLFDKDFNMVKSVFLNELGNVRRARLTFNSNLYGIVASDHYVYINNMDQNHIIVLDESLDAVMGIFEPLKVKSIFEIEVFSNMLFVFDNRNREVFRFNAVGKLIDSVKLEATSLEKYAQNENFSKIENSERFACISNSFAISKNGELAACYRPFLGEINVHKLHDGSLLQVIENVYKCKISICFASNYLLEYSGAEGSVTFYEYRADNSHDSEESKLDIDSDDNDAITTDDEDHSNRFRFVKIGRISRPKLVCYQHYHYLSCHKKLLYFNNRIFVLFSENNNIGLIDC